jgi:hypothetical protein
MKHVCLLLLGAVALAAQTPGPLPHTTLWDFRSSIVDDQYRELSSFYESRIREAAPRREQFSRQDADTQRKLLRELTGSIDQPMAPAATRLRSAKPGNTRHHWLPGHCCVSGRHRRHVAPGSLVRCSGLHTIHGKN